MKLLVPFTNSFILSLPTIHRSSHFWPLLRSIFRLNLTGSHGDRMSLRLPCRSPAPTASPTPFSSVARTPLKFCPETRRSVLPTLTLRRRRKKSPSPDSSKTSETSSPDLITSRGSSHTLLMPPPEKNPLHGFLR